MSYDEILSKEPKEFLRWLVVTFSITIIKHILTADDLKIASSALLKLSGYYSYLVTLQTYAKIETRNKKRYSDKKTYEDYIDKKEAIFNMIEIVKQEYASISRAVTIYQNIVAELRMNETGAKFKRNF